jgi:hypothetical protein
MSPSAYWAQKDLLRIQGRLFHYGVDELEPEELVYLRNWALLLLASDMDLSEKNLRRLRWMVRWIDGERIPEHAA